MAVHIAKTARWGFFLSMAAGSALIAWTSVPYFFGEELHEFIVEKLPLPHEGLWLGALHVHVVSALFSLPACVLLVSRPVLRRWPSFHRVFGRVTGIVVLLALVPSGAYLALYAKGGWPSTLGFLVSACIVAGAMIRGVAQARASAFAAHRRCMLHVVAQLSVAVTSRALLAAFDRAGMDVELAYVIALWLPVAGSALIASLIGGYPRRSHETHAHTLALHPAL
jgi:uncharacterized membrane protein